MKIVFAGTTRFGIPALELILKSGHELLAVITQPDRPVGRKQTLTETPIKTWALKRQIKTLAPEKIQDAAAEIRNLSPDVMVVAAYGQIIPADVLEIPKFGSFNLHASILPKYRGASPIQAALIEGEKETGVTLILMDEKMDHGPMAGFAKTEIDPKDTFDSLYDKLANAAAGLLLERLPQIEDKSLKLIAQNHEQATFTRMIRRQDARINWTEDAAKIARTIKAYDPEPGAWTTLDQKTVKILAAKPATENRIELPGKIFRHAEGAAVKCGTNLLILQSVQPEGKKPMDGRDFLNGIKNLETKIFV